MTVLAQVSPSDRRPVPRWLRRLLGPAWLLAAWFIMSATGFISHKALSPPAEVWSTLIDLISKGQLQHHLWVSLHRVVYGLTIGISAGLLLALLSGLFRWGEDLIDGPMQILRSLPVLALTGLMVVWLGIGEEPKIALIALAVTFPVYINTFAAIRSVDDRLIESATTFGLGRIGLIRHVILPSALPGFFSGLRFAFAVSWLVLVVSEQINATSGLGFLAMQGQMFLRPDLIVVALLVYGVLGFLSDAIVRLLERSALQWRSSFSGT
jgi:sulfonate transport system permease protein